MDTSGHCTVHELTTLTTVNYVTAFEFPERRRHAWFTRVGNVVNTYGVVVWGPKGPAARAVRS